jgi:hypothetical protein
MVLTYKNKFNKKYGFKLNEPHSLEEISKITNYNLNGLKIIFSKGQAAFFNNEKSVRPHIVSANEWAQSRIYSAVMGGKASIVDKAHLIKNK